MNKICISHPFRRQIGWYFFPLSLFLRFRSFQILKVPFSRKWKHFVIGEDVYFAVASNSRSHDSPIFKWNGDMFVPFQNLPTTKAFDVEPFKIGQDTFLAVANYYGRSSQIFKWDGERFVKFQDIAAVGADVEHFEMDGTTYLAVTGISQEDLFKHIWTSMQGGVGGGREGVGRNLIYSTYFSDVFTTIGIAKITQHVNLTKSAPCF